MSRTSKAMLADKVPAQHQASQATRQDTAVTGQANHGGMQCSRGLRILGYAASVLHGTHQDRCSDRGLTAWTRSGERPSVYAAAGQQSVPHRPPAPTCW